MQKLIDQLVHWYTSALEAGGYPLIALLMAIESSVFPLPSEVVIPPAAHLANTGRIPLTLWGIVLAGTCRREDVTSANTVLSSQLANLTIVQNTMPGDALEANVLTDLANTSLLQSDFPAALPLYERALAISRERLSPGDLDNVTHVSLDGKFAHGTGHGRRCRTITRKVPPRSERFHASDRWGHPFEDIDTLLDVIKVSSAGSLLARAGLVLSRNFQQDIFALSIAAKDVGLALESGQAVGAEMPLTAAARDVYQRALAQGLGSEDFIATVKVLEATAGITLPALARPKAAS